MPTPRLTKIFLVAAIIAGCAWQLHLVDDGLGISWANDVVRNWLQFGFFKLHGQLVMNTGGFEATTRPTIYPGMSPVCLWPVFFVIKLFGWTGLGTMSFHILLALAVFWGVWKLLGRDDFALAAAAAAILSPGYDRWQKMLDPNTLSVLPVLPYAAIILSILKKKQPGWTAVTGLAVLTLAFTSLNWTTAWVFGPLALMLLGWPKINLRATILFIALAGTSCFLFAAGSALARTGGGQSGSGGAKLVQLLSAYTWGSGGYGTGLTTGKALMRLAFVNLVALLPLLLVFGFALAKTKRGAWKESGLAAAPFMLTVCEIAFMRNYFAHHPWMAAPVLLVGLVFSLALLRAQGGGDGIEKISLAQKKGFVPAMALLCFAYGLAVLIFFRANEANALMLADLVRQQTGRSDCLVVLKNTDPATARLAFGLRGTFDRHIVVVDDLQHLPANENRIVILSAVPVAGPVKLLAQMSAHTSPQSWLQKTADWFNHSIARRNPGDHVELADDYFLYEPRR